ncbi:MAG TPA: DUF1990 family protein [Myxococcales bacterium]|jgi:uncharacterized membrane protein/uncharacterized protein (UPF0548 family)
MAEWRWGRGWSGEELQVLGGAVDPERRNFDARPDEMTLERGWNQVRSEAVVAREAPGAPRPGGAFVRARELVDALRFSDPRIVVPHFDEGAPLLGRVMLLELRAPFDLRFLCPVVVRAARTDPAAFGFSIATLEGHVEAGQEWFLLTKDPATGEVRFRIEARWRPGQFPTWWSYLGFQFAARPRQRAWHRLAYLRLRRLLAPQPESETEMSQLPALDLVARKRTRGHPLGIDLEQERVRRERLPLVAALSATCGARSMMPPALFARALSKAPRPPQRRGARWFARPGAARVLAALALGELVADLMPQTPSRRVLPSLFARAASGALVGFLAAAQGRRRAAGPTLLGAASALAGTFASSALRQRMIRRVGDPVAGLVEDAAVAAAAEGLIGLLGARARGRLEAV